MFNDKRIQYIIVAALATSFSSDAFASTRNDVDSNSTSGVAEFEATEYGEGAPTRARSRGFAESTTLDTKIWNNGLVSLASSATVSSMDTTSDCTSSDCCKSSQSSVLCSEQVSNRIDLGNGRTLEVESIRFDDGVFATTLVGEHSMHPVAINLREALPQLGDHKNLDARFAFEPMTFESNGENHYRWSFAGRVIDSQSPATTYVEGDLPMQIHFKNGGELSVQIDSAALREALS